MRKKLARKLVPGAPFTLNIDGKPIYRGAFTSILSSASVSAPVILLDVGGLDPTLGPDEMQIQLGYPSKKFFEGKDPRSDDRLLMALKSSGRLAVSVPRPGDDLKPKLKMGDAISKAIPYMFKRFPESFERHKPYQARLEKGNWTVFGTLPKGTPGGTPSAIVRDADGAVISVFHTQ